MRVLVLGMPIYGMPFGLLGHEIIIHPPGADTAKVDIPDAVVFTGGPDICPKWYGKNSIDKNAFYDHRRDAQEMSLYERATKKDAIVIGICRGAQLINVANGGTLVQDVLGHRSAHGLFYRRGEEVIENMMVTSTHHQLMVPPAKVGELLAWSTAGYKYSSTEGLPVIGNGRFKDPEVVWFPHSRSMAIQFHPERMIPLSEFPNGRAVVMEQAEQQARIKAYGVFKEIMKIAGV